MTPLGALAIAAVGVAWLLGASAAGAATRTDAFPAVADARVQEADPAVSFGASKRIGADGDAGAGVESVLRFDVSGITGEIDAATLRLYAVSDGTLDGPEALPAGDGWSESTVSWESRPTPTGAAVSDLGPVSAGAWTELDVTALVTGNGTVSLLLRQPGHDGVVFYGREGSHPPQLVVESHDPIVMAAGDIACRPGSTVTATRCRHGSVAALLRQEPSLDHVLALGDLQYEDARYDEFMGPGTYDSTWGAVKPITRPVPGNHEYHIDGATGYFDYFNGIGGFPGPAGQRGRGYYSFDAGNWHLVALNSEIPASAGSEQERWLRSDLAATTRPCVLAYWHAPRFSSGSHGGTTRVAGLWNALYDARADIVLSGHDHDYERFAQQDPGGEADPEGIRQFVVGTGGASHGILEGLEPNSEVRDALTFGVLKLTLRAAGYDWEFVPTDPGAFTDAGTARCNDDPPTASLAVGPATGAAPLTVTADASGSTDGDRTPIAGYALDFGDGSRAGDAVATHTYEQPGTYTVAVTVTDTGGQTGTATARVVVTGNLVADPSFETGTRGWMAQPAGAVVDRVAGGHTGAMAARVRNAGSGVASCALNDSPNWAYSTSADTYTASLWVRADSPGATLKLRLTEWSAGLPASSTRAAVTLTTAWQLVTVSHTTAARGRSTLDLNAYVMDAPPGTCFYADDALLAPG